MYFLKISPNTYSAVTCALFQYCCAESSMNWLWLGWFPCTAPLYKLHCTTVTLMYTKKLGWIFHPSVDPMFFELLVIVLEPCLLSINHCWEFWDFVFYCWYAHVYWCISSHLRSRLSTFLLNIIIGICMQMYRKLFINSL